MLFSEGLGKARDNFSANLARLKNLRQRTAVLHDKELGVVQEAADAFHRNFRTARGPAALAHVWWSGDLGLWFQDSATRLQEERQTTREMMFVYLIIILDGFFGQWIDETGLGAAGVGGRHPPANPKTIAEAVLQLMKRRRGRIVGLHLLSQARKDLREIRARRDVLVHRGGIPDAIYCKAAGNQAAKGQRLDVHEAYLDKAVEFVDDLVAAMAIKTYEGTQSPTNAANRQALVARVFR